MNEDCDFCSDPYTLERFDYGCPYCGDKRWQEDNCWDFYQEIAEAGLLWQRSLGPAEDGMEIVAESNRRSICQERNPCGCPIIHDPDGPQHCPGCLGPCHYCNCAKCQRYWWEYHQQHTLAVCLLIPFALNIRRTP